NSEGSNMRRKNITTQATSAPSGKVILFEGRDDPRTATWSGVLLTQDQYDEFVDWFEKRHQFEVTDDLGRIHMVYIQSLDLTRRKSMQHPWFHDFSMEVIYIDWV